MIELMLKTTVICRSEDRETSLNKLRDLGVLHVDNSTTPSSSDITSIKDKIREVSNIITILSEIKPSKTSKPSEMSGKRLAQDAIKIQRHIHSNSQILQNRHKDRMLLIPWGNFSNSTLNDIQKKGLYVHFCTCYGNDINKYKELGSVSVISNVKNKFYFIIVSDYEINKSDLPLAPMPTDNTTLDLLDKQIKILTEDIDKNSKILKRYVHELSKIKDYLSELEEENIFFANREGMGTKYSLCYISGFIPEKLKSYLLKASTKYHWAVLFQEPEPEDRVPTYLSTPKLFRIAKPIFEFIGIAPGYNEWDVSVCFLFFFTIFFGMLVGDAGYGALFLIIGIFCKIKFRKKKELRLPLNLFIVLSIVTIIWGLLTCTILGIPQHYFPKYLQGLHSLTAPSVKNQTIQLICFLIGVIHLSLARIWKAYIYRKGLFKALGEVGWALVLWGNFFVAVKLIVYPDLTLNMTILGSLYAIGVILILAFSVDWTEIGDIFNLPFGFIGSFVDILSYIRLFAVGLATTYIAISFNQMGIMVLDISPWLFAGTVIILLFGHILNIALAFMGVLVHGIRLNTLEFSNHMKLEWTGTKYIPFKKNKDEALIEKMNP